MSDCKHCGEPIQWLVDDNGRWVPAEPDSVADEEATGFDPAAGHERHDCQPVRELNEVDYQRQLDDGEST